MEDVTVRRLIVDGVEVDLRRVNGRQVLVRCADGEEVELSGAEVAELLNARPHAFARLDRLGVDVGQAPSDSFFTEHQAHLLRQLPDEELLVMLDTSTLNGAALCIGGSYVSPASLLELSVLTFALVCCDRIVVQPGSVLSIPEELAQAFISLRYPPDFIPQTLWSFCADLYNDEDAETRDEYARAWARFFDVPPTDLKVDLRLADGYQDSPLQWSGVFAHAYFEARVPPAFGQASVGDDARERDTFLALATMRTLFNDRLAGFLRVPYLASSLRGPVHAVLLARKAERQLVADRLIAALGPPAADASDSGPYMSEVSAPFLLGLVLERMQQPGDYWQVVAEYRKRFAPLRRRLLRDRDAWNGRAGPYLHSLLAPLAETNEVFRRSIDGAAIVTSTLASAIRPDVAAASAGVKLARLAFPAEHVRRAYYRCFRPELHLLLSVASEADALRSVEDRIEALWGKAWTRSDRDALARLAAVQPPDFARLRSLA